MTARRVSFVPPKAPPAPLHERAMHLLYGKTPAPAPVPRKSDEPKMSRAQASAVMYAGSSATTCGSLDTVDQSFWLSRIRQAKAEDNHVKAARLEQQRREFLDAAREGGLSETQARRIAVVLRDTDARPLQRDRLTEYDELELQRKHGADTQRLVTAGYQYISGLIEKRPALLEAVRQGGAWAHGEVADVAAELAAARGLAPSEPTAAPAAPVT